MQGTRLAIIFKKSRTDTQWENFIANKIPECREKGPISRPYLEKLILVLY